LDFAGATFTGVRAPGGTAAFLLCWTTVGDPPRVIADIFELNHRCYGYRRIRAALIRQQVFISEKVVRRLMRQEGLAAATTWQRRYGSYRGEISPAPDNI